MYGVGLGGSRLGWRGKLSQSMAHFLSMGRVRCGKKGPPCCRAELAAPLSLCLAAALPVPLGGLAKCLWLHLNALCSVLIRTKAEPHSPLSCFGPHGMPYHIWCHFCFPVFLCSLDTYLLPHLKDRQQSKLVPPLHVTFRQDSTFMVNKPATACKQDTRGCQCAYAYLDLNARCECKGITWYFESSRYNLIHEGFCVTLLIRNSYLVYRCMTE